MAQINKPTDYFNTVTWSGDGTSPRTISGVGFQPEWVWLKHRSGTGTRDHYLSDVVRGATKSLNSNTTDAEVATESNGYTSAFASDGFTLTSGSNSIGDVNDSARTYVAWNWLAGGTASSNTDGSITSSVSANTTAGFSIVSYTGTGSALTCGHGLGAVPKMIIVKDRDASANWNTYHVANGNANTVQLNLGNAPSATSSWNSTTPTSSVFSLGAVGAVNTSGNDYIAYCFSEKKGYSKIGSYTGNGNTDGTFLYLGFKPAFIIIKDISSTDPWHIIDAKRNTVNVMNARLFPNTNGVESTSTNICDFVSNGIKFRGTNDGFNGSRNYLYMAFAEQPLVGTNNITATAR